MLFKNRQIFAGACRMFNKASNPDYLPTAGLVPFDHFQASLPRLPIPRLEDTLDRYLYSQRAIASDQLEYDNTVQIVKNFQHGIGAELHRQLRRRELYDRIAGRHNSYISDLWFSWGYLGSRSQLPSWYNPALSFAAINLDKLGDKIDRQVASATNYIVSSLRFMKTLDNGTLAPALNGIAPGSDAEDRFLDSIRNLPRSFAALAARRFYNVTPIDISQFTRLFRSTRVPQEEGDDVWRTVHGGKLTVNGGAASEQLGFDRYVLPFEFSVAKNTVKHITVLSNGSIFKVRVLDDHGCIESAAEIYRRLAYVREQAKAPSTKRAALETGSQFVSFGTTMERSSWAKLRRRIETHSDANRATFDAIDSSLFAVAFSDLNAADESQLNKHFLLPEVGHDSATLDAWYDKCFTLLFTPKGRCAINFEHSSIDGAGIMRFMRDVQADVVRRPAVETAFQLTPLQVVGGDVATLHFDCDAQTRAQLEAAAKAYRSARDSLSLTSVRVAKCGKKSAKLHKVSADALTQLAFQLAYRGLFGRLGSVYESCSTAPFCAGRTETIRSASVATRRFIDAFQSGKRADDLALLLRDCSASHTRLVKEASNGLGWDRHLLALHSLATESPQRTPLALFVDPAYRRIKHIDLSTSQLTDARTVDAFAFGPVELDCVGIGYQVHDDHIKACLTCFPQHTNGISAARFGEALSESLEEISKLLGSSAKS